LSIPASTTARWPGPLRRRQRAAATGLAARKIDDPTGWLAEIGGDLDRALAETVTLAVNDVLLGQLLDQLDAVPLARRLLLGISVYRPAFHDPASRHERDRLTERRSPGVLAGWRRQGE
jgi:hypothetical protein